MRKLRISFSLAIMMLLVGLFSISAFAQSNVTSNTDPNAAGVDTNGSLAPDITTDPSANDNDLTNVNQTGKNVTTNDGSTVNDVIKSRGMVDKNTAGVHNQRTHGEYQNNTNSCASCHQTHTGASKNLLFKDGVYSTCTACHDGTLGFYNVFQASTAGTFGGDTNHNASMHMANESLTASAAPGGNRTGTDEKSWGKEFNCASCHSPHGSYSDRLLNYNPNNMGAVSSKEGGNAAWSKIWDTTDIATIKADVAAKVAADASYDPRKEYGKFINIRGTLTDLGITPQAGTTDTGSTVAIAVFGFSVDHGTWSLTLTTDPLLNADEYASPYKAYDLKLYNVTDNTTDTKKPQLDADGNPVTTDTKDANGKVIGRTVNLVDGSNGIPDEVDAIPAPYLADQAAKVFDANDKNLVIRYNAGYIIGQDYHDAGKDGIDGNADDTNLTNPISTLNYGEVARAYIVKMDLVQYPANDVATNRSNALFAPGGMLSYVSSANLGTNDFGGIQIKYSKDATLYGYSAGGKGIKMSNYCAACHTDYLATSGKGTGTFSTAYRHTTEVDTYTCVRCHFAHGTDAYQMKDAEGNDVADLTDSAYMTSKGKTAMTEADALTYLKDNNTSSALKKFTNMSGCWSCHNSSHAEQLINNPTGQQFTDPTQSWAGETK